MKFFFFDLDGTLEDSRQDMVAAAQHVRTTLGLNHRDFSELVPHVNRGMRELYCSCFDDYVFDPQTRLIDEEKLSTVQRLYEHRYEQHIAVNTRLYPGVFEALQLASSLGRIAVITNKPEHLSRRLLDSLGLSTLVELVVGGDTCREAKPSPLPLQHAFEKLGGQQGRDQVFMVGDSQGDSRAGALFGATTVWCAWGYQDRAPTDPAPHVTAAKAEDLCGIFKNLEC